MLCIPRQLDRVATFLDLDLRFRATVQNRQVEFLVLFRQQSQGRRLNSTGFRSYCGQRVWWSRFRRFGHHCFLSHTVESRGYIIIA